MATSSPVAAAAAPGPLLAIHLLLLSALLLPGADAGFMQRRWLGRSSENPFDGVLGKIKDINDKVEDVAEEAYSKGVRASDRVVDTITGERVPRLKKPLMERINVLRARLCWERPSLKNHEDCMRFLGLHCDEESTGEGICRDFEEYVEEACKAGRDIAPKDPSVERLCETSARLRASDRRALAKQKDLETPGESDIKKLGAEGGANGTAGSGAAGAGAAGGGADRDGDGHPDNVDAFPDNPDEWEDTDGDGIGNNADKDRDGDGHNNDKDLFPDDTNEWEDLDKDGIGNNADKDRDGDGYDNDVDAFPDDPSEWKDSDRDGRGDNSDPNRDGDLYDNDEDVFPDDPKEWLDTDGDGVGDNADHYPYNRYCYDATKPCNRIDDRFRGKDLAPGADPVDLDKVKKPLPPQGYSEYARGPPVEHSNYYTWTGDWGDEWPMRSEPDRATIDRICRENPKNQWCRHHEIHGHFNR